MKIFVNLIVLSVLLFFVASIKAQTHKVDILNFLVDGEEPDCQVEILLEIDGSLKKPEVKTEVESKSFVVPSGVIQAKRIDLTITCGKHKLAFKSLKPSDFVYKDAKYEWVIGIDNFPFEQAYVYPEIADRVKAVHYIKFHAEGFVSTSVQVLIPKQLSKKKFPVKSNRRKN